jgi:hypothetical protein
MHKRLIVFTILIFCTLAWAEWQSIGPYGGALRVLAVSPSNDNIIYTFSNTNVLFKSIDGAATWNEVGSISDNIYSMAIDPTDPDIMYAGGIRHVYKSTDGGANWSSCSLSYGAIYGLAVHPNTPSTIFAVGSVLPGVSPVMGFFKSTDGGSNWSELALSSFKGTSISFALDPSNPNTMYVGGSYYNVITYPAIYKSTDGGSSFFESSTGIPDSAMNVYSLEVHPTNSNIIYAGTYDGGYRSVNGAGAWFQVVVSARLTSFSTTPVAPNIVYAGSDTIIFKSSNSGASWFIPGSGYSTGFTKQGRCVAVSPNSASIVYTSEYKGCYKTINGGTNWSPYNYGMLMAVINCFDVSLSSPSTVYAEYYRVGVYKTTDNGSNWIDLNSSNECGGFCALEIHNTNPNIVYGLEGSG